MIVKFLKATDRHRKGDVAKIADKRAKELIDRGLAEKTYIKQTTKQGDKNNLASLANKSKETSKTSTEAENSTSEKSSESSGGNDKQS